MFEALKDFALEKGYALARRKGMKCPECGRGIDMPEQMPEGGLNARFECYSCSWNGTLVDAVQSNDEYERDVDTPKPAKCRVVEGFGPEGRSWTIPAKMWPNFFWVFSIFWLGITGAVTFGFIFGEPVDGNTGEPASPFWILFFIPFWAVGIGTFYAAMRMSFMKQTLVIGRGGVTLHNTLFGWTTKKSIERHNVKGVERKEAYKQNNTPVYNVTITAKEGKAIKFGSGLKNEEKSWLCSVLRKELKVKSDPTYSGPRVSDRNSTFVEERELDEIQEKGLVLRRTGAEEFEMVLDYRFAPWLLFISMITFGVSGFLFWQAYQDFSADGGGGFTIFELLSGLFSVVPALIGVVFFVASLVLIGVGGHFLGYQKKLEFLSNELVIHKGKKGTEPKVERYARTSFSAVKKSNSGSVNNEPRYKVVLHGDKAVTVAGFVKPTIAGELEQWLLHWIQTDAISGYGAASQID